MSSNSSTCSEEILDDSSYLLKGISVFLIIGVLATTCFLSVSFCLHRKSFAVLRARSHILTVTIVIGGTIQVCWAVLALIDRKGFPCLILSDLIIFVVTLQIAPRVISCSQIYFKTVLNKQLAKFQLVSSLNLGVYRSLELVDGDSGSLIVEETKISMSTSCCHLILGNLCNVLFSNERQQKAFMDTVNLSDKLIGAGNDLYVTVALEHFPEQYVFVLASESFAFVLQMAMIMVSLIYLLVFSSDEALCVSPCDGVTDSLKVASFGAFVLAPLGGYYMYLIRKEPDPLGLVRELRMCTVSDAILGTSTVILFYLDPGNLEENGDFLWGLVWLIGSWIEIVLALGFPLYLAWKQHALKEKCVLRNISLGQVLESKAGRDLFKTFLVFEMSVENYLFWRSAKKYTDGFVSRSQEDNIKIRMAIANVYLNSESQLGVNVSGHSVEEVFSKLNHEPQPDDFSEAVTEVLQNLGADSFTRFTQTPEFRNLFQGGEI